MSGWLKFTGMILVAIVLNYLGWQIAALYKKRIGFWAQTKAMADYFCDQIRFTADQPEKIWRRFVSLYPKNDWQIDDYQEGSFEERFSLCAKTVAARLALTGESIALLEAFGKGLGTTDLEGQLNHCTSYSHLFLQQENQAAEEYRTKGKLYRTFCMLASVGFAVMLL